MRLFGWIKVTGGLLLIAAAAGIYGLSVFRRRREARLKPSGKEAQSLAEKSGARVDESARHISEGLAVLHDARSLTITVSYTVVVLADGRDCAPAGRARIRDSLRQVPFTGAVFVMGLSMLGSVVPTPGGATGPFHIATAASLAFLGVDQDSQNPSRSFCTLLSSPPRLFSACFTSPRKGCRLSG